MLELGEVGTVEERGREGIVELTKAGGVGSGEERKGL